MNTQRATEFADMANGLGSGFMKPRVAWSMMSTLDDTPDIASDSVRLLSWVENALQMEGFGPVEIEKIVRWIQKEL